MVAAEAGLRVAERQAARALSGLAHTTQQTQEDFKTNNTAGCNVSEAFGLEAWKKLTGAGDPRHAPQANGGLAEHWYLDNGDNLCHPILVLPNLQASDTANAKIGAERNKRNTEVIYHVADLDAAPPEWKINDVRPLVSVATAVRGHVTLGVETSSWQKEVIRTMHEHVQLCQGPADRICPSLEIACASAE